MVRSDASRTYPTGQRSGAIYLVGLAMVVGFIAAEGGGLLDLPADGGAQPSPAAVPVASPTPSDPSRFILNALLVPALDGDAMPLRWVDPRSAMQCGPGTTVRVDGAQLQPGALVPDASFEIEWRADGCRPFGTSGPRFDGAAQLTVFREDWGFTAIVDPFGLRMTSPGQAPIFVRPSAVSMPQSPDDEAAFAVNWASLYLDP